MTQRELADRLYVSDKAVSKWERGLSLPDVALLIPLGDCLGVSVTELLRGERTGQETLPVDEVEALVNASLGFTGAEQQTAHRRVLPFLFEQLLEGKAGIDHHVLAARMDGLGQIGQRFRLQEGFPAGKGDAAQQRVFVKARQYGVRWHHRAAVKGMGVRIMAAGAMVFAALREDHEAHPRPVHYGLFHNAAHPQIRHA